MNTQPKALRLADRLENEPGYDWNRNYCLAVAELRRLYEANQMLIKALEKGAVIRLAYCEGAFLGEGLWTLESADDQTRLRYRWRADPNGWLLKSLAPVIPVAKSHSDVMAAGFANLNKSLEMK